MVSGPVGLQVLEGEDAIAKNRALMGATDRRRPNRHHPCRLRESIDAIAVQVRRTRNRGRRNRLFFLAAKFYAGR